MADDHICQPINGTCPTCRASMWTGEIPVTRVDLR